MRAIICDDDHLVRSVVGVVAAENGFEVVGEAEDVLGALELLEQLRPDVAVVDLALRYSNGLELIKQAWDLGCRVIVFSSFVPHDLAASAPGGPLVVDKPEFDRLAEAFQRVAHGTSARVEDRRSRRRREADPLAGFHQAVAGAVEGDAIVILAPWPADARVLDVVGTTAERTTAAQDRLEVTETELRLLLMGAGADGATAVINRIGTAAGVDLGTWVRGVAVVSAELSGVDAYQQLRSELRDAAG